MRTWALLAVAVALAACNPQKDDVVTDEDLRVRHIPQPLPNPMGRPADAPPGSQAAALLDALPKAKASGFIASPANVIRFNALVSGALEFVLFHEVGHFLMQDYDIKNPGGAEIAADRFATFAMTPPPRPPGSPREMLDPAGDGAPSVLWATVFWRHEQLKMEEHGIAFDWSDEHGLPEQRMRQLLCLLYGAEPDRWIKEKTFVENLTPEKREFCLFDAHDNARVWSHYVGSRIATTPDAVGLYNPGVLYEAAPPEHAAYRDWLMRTGLLEYIAGEIGQLKLPDDAGAEGRAISLVASPCRTDKGYEANAKWMPAKRSIILCYGLIQLFDGYTVEILGNMPAETQQTPVRDR